MTELKTCPFCGGRAEKKRIGNDYTRKRSIEIRCTQCRVKRVDGAIRHGFDWLDEVATKNWNQRPTSEGD